MKYSSTEEKWNIRTHALGFIASIPASLVLLSKSSGFTSTLSSAVFGLSLMLLYLASTLYHASKDEEKRIKLRIFDHAAIYILIAGTYTPVCLISLKETVGTILLISIWSIALAGVILKLFYTGRFDRASTVLYVLMGWIAIFAVQPLIEALSNPPLLWLLAGGVCYTTGAVIYSIKSISFNHAIFHVFVLGGSTCHYLMIYWYII